MKNKSRLLPKKGYQQLKRLCFSENGIITKPKSLQAITYLFKSVGQQRKTFISEKNM